MVSELKCVNCNSEWQPPKNISSMFCPFCQAPLMVVKEQFTDLDSVFSYLASEFGNEILKNKRNVLQFLETFFSEGKQEYNLVSSLYASGLVETLFRLRNASEAIQKSAVKQVENQFCDKYGISRDWAEYIVGCVCNSLGLANNIERSIVKVKQAAERGDLSAQVALAKCYHLGQGVERNQQQYIRWLKRSASSGCGEALFLLGEALFIGSVCDKNIEAATDYLEKAAQKHSPDAICLISSNVDLQRVCNVDLERELVSLLENRDALSPKQLIQISEYYDGKDVALSLELARLSYEKDSKYAWEYYVSLLQKNKTHENKALALKATKEIAGEGNVAACLSLAKYYESQAKSENDMLTAIYWYRIAAEIGNLDAMLRLAEIHETGKLIHKDVETAIYWYKIAAFNGSQIAKRKVSYKSSECIVSNLTIVLEDNTELECNVQGVVTYQGNEYLIIEDPDSKALIPVKYIENSTIEGFEIEEVNENTEKSILRKFGGVNR
jgi:hypothetical protein